MKTTEECGCRALRELVAEYEARMIALALERHEGRKVETARCLGITRENLWQKLTRYGMQQPQLAPDDGRRWRAKR